MARPDRKAFHPLRRHWPDGRGRLSGAAGPQAWAKARLGKTQRLTVVKIMNNLPRNGAGKVTKRELRDEFH
jgi:acyl-coenzyme A synthetase/AMP-(fatty) acid ligase